MIGFLRHGLLTSVFLAVVCGLPLIQAVDEAVKGARPHALDIFLHAPSAAHLRGYEETLESESLLAKVVRPGWQYAQAAVLGGLGAMAVPGRDGWLFYRPGVEAVVAGTQESEAAFQAIVSFHRDLAARGIHLLLIPTPDKASVYPDYLTGRLTSAALPLPSPGRALLTRLRGKGIEALDLYERYAAARQSGGEALYLERDTHWTPVGMELAADAAAARLVSLGWVMPESPGYTRRECAASRAGDIVAMMQSPALAGLFSGQDVVCGQISDASGAPFHAAASGEVVVLGDSFCRIYETDAPGSSGFIAHLAYRLGCPVAGVVNDGGAATEVRQVFARKPALNMAARVVLWQFAERDLLLDAGAWRDVALSKKPSGQGGEVSAIRNE